MGGVLYLRNNVATMDPKPLSPLTMLQFQVANGIGDVLPLSQQLPTTLVPYSYILGPVIKHHTFAFDVISESPVGTY